MVRVEAKDVRFVQVSDVRFSDTENSQILDKIIKDINRQKDVEFVVFTGDNIEKPSSTLLEGFLNEIKKLKYPYYIVIGDKEVNKHKNLSKVEYTKILKKNIRKYQPELPYYTFEKSGVIFIVMDGAKDVIPSTNGYYKDSILEWLSDELNKYPGKNVIILQHFPIVAPVERETYYTFKPEKYLQIIAEHKNVKAIFAGHFGVNSEQKIGNIEHITTSGMPYYRIIDIIDSDTDNPTIWAQLKKVE